MGADVAVFTPDHKPVAAGSNEPGFIARGGNIPVGYWKDEAKTAKTFSVIDGQRWSIPGDYLPRQRRWLDHAARAAAALCINTAGEKVYPEEVEETLKLHDSVDDALVVGVPDEKWGNAVTAVVELAPGARFDESALRTHVREHLAGYKTPKRILVVAADVPRAERQGGLQGGHRLRPLETRPLRHARDRRDGGTLCRNACCTERRQMGPRRPDAGRGTESSRGTRPARVPSAARLGRPRDRLCRQADAARNPIASFLRLRVQPHEHGGLRRAHRDRACRARSPNAMSPRC